MSRPSLSARLAVAAGQTPAPEPQAANEPPPASKARTGKTMIAEYFSPELARAIEILAVERGVTVQALIGEGLDAVLRQHDRHPMGER